MKTYDITLTIRPSMPVWPGDPEVQLDRVSKIEDGANANVSHVAFSAHTGTHVDAPYHFLGDSPITVDLLPLSILTGRVYVLHIGDEVDLITASLLEQMDIPQHCRRLLFRTRNSKLWAEGNQSFQTDFVGLDTTAATFVINRGIQLVGIDYLSIAPYKKSRPTHEILLKAGVVILEGANLSEVPGGRYTLYCLPLKLGGADGAPTRAILVGY